MSSKLREECGVCGVWNHPDASVLIYYALYALQHRGQESAGIAVSPGAGEPLSLYRGMGLVSEVFSGEDIDRLQGRSAIGHVRYGTAGSNSLLNAQPLVVRLKSRSLGLAHNGNLINATQLRRELEHSGSIFQTTSDTEVLAHLTARDGEVDIEEGLLAALRRVRGAYSLVMLTPEAMYAARDPHGIRPLCLGRVGDGLIIASETCALDTAGAEFVRDVQPGEFVRIDHSGIHSRRISREEVRPAPCVFEYIYFARPDSNLAGSNVHQVRKRLGEYLAEDHPVVADVASGVPDSSISAATGYAEAADIPYEMGLVRNRYIGRTFIQPEDRLRQLGVNLKFNPLHKVVRDARVVLVDDSIVRGTTSRALVELLKEAGAREIHLRISSPPYRHPCPYGIDTRSPGDLIAAGRTVAEIQKLVGADSLGYLSEERVTEAAGGCPEDFCTACFSGRYPVPVDEDGGSSLMESDERE